MRPVVRGRRPAGLAIKKYADARPGLIAAIGAYCSYCEMRHPTPAVEHVQPKSTVAGLTLSWSNFLLSCTSCNSIKGKKKVVLSDYIWPDRHATSRAFVYLKMGGVDVKSTLGKATRRRAQNTKDLFGLNRTLTSTPPATAADRRWIERLEAWLVAERCRVLWTRTRNAATKELIIQVALKTGFWSVWMIVFGAESPMVKQLIRAFPGTALKRI